MELEEISIDEGVPEDVVQFVKHLEENLDPNNEFDCQVWIRTVQYDELDELPGDDITTRGPDPVYAGPGVEIEIEFVENSDCPSREFSELANSFFNQDEYVLSASFDGGEGHYVGYVFLTE